MAKQLKTERAALQQKLLHDSLIALMETTGYADISVSGICSRAGIPRRTFYYYFDGKEDVLSSLIDLMMMESELESMIFDRSPVNGLEQSLTRFFLYWKNQRRKELCAIIQNGLEQELIMHCLKWVSSEQRWMHMLEHYTEEEQSVSMLLGITSVFYTLFHWCSRDFRQSPEYMAACVTRILTKPLYAPE